ncbi:class I SAM-dependent rRNA methyltransferase [soil metagenome]
MGTLDTVRTAILTKRGANRARSGHPWIYRSDVAEASGEPGDAVRVADGAGRCLGTAFYNPESEITLRIADHRDVNLDRDWMRSRLHAAVAYRDTLTIDSEAYRLVHAEADGIPGLVVDRYGPYAVLQVGSAAVERRLPWIVELLSEMPGVEGILLRGDTASRKREGLSSRVERLYGEVPGSVVVREGPVSYVARLGEGQKTGGFLDQRENHLAAGRYAADLRHAGRVLDVFSYAGLFALHAARSAPEAEVEAVDSSQGALDAGAENARLNGLKNLNFTRSDAFDLLRARSRSGEAYDLIVLDPPAFAKGKRDLTKARRAYKEINLRAMNLLVPGGLLFTCSCSYHLSRQAFGETLASAASDAGAAMRVREWRGQSADHPELLTVPETAYLKCAVLQRV